MIQVLCFQIPASKRSTAGNMIGSLNWSGNAYGFIGEVPLWSLFGARSSWLRFLVDVLSSSGQMPVTTDPLFPLLYNSLCFNNPTTPVCKLITKLSLCTPWKHMGKCRYTYTVSWPRPWLGVSDQLHVRASLSRRKNPPYPLHIEWFWTLWRREKIPCLCWESNYGAVSYRYS